MSGWVKPGEWLTPGFLMEEHEDPYRRPLGVPLDVFMLQGIVPRAGVTRTAQGVGITEGQGDQDGVGPAGNVTLAAGEVLMVVATWDQAHSVGAMTVTWNGNNVPQIAFGNWGPIGDLGLAMFAYRATVGGTGTLIGIVANALCSSMIMLASSFKGMSTATLDVTMSQDGLSGTTMDSGFSAATTNPKTLVYAAIGTDNGAPQIGTWADGQVAGQKGNTTGVPMNLEESWRTIASVAAVRARKTGVTSAAWEARVCAVDI